MGPGKVYDVAIGGSGLAGATLATVQARHGLSVLMLERGTHPRFAIGESTVPELGARAQFLAAYFAVPELAYMSNFPLLRVLVDGPHALGTPRPSGGDAALLPRRPPVLLGAAQGDPPRGVARPAGLPERRPRSPLAP